MGTLWAQLLLQFATDCFETLPMYIAWNEDVHIVWVYFDFFSYFFLFVNLLFWYEIVSKCIDSGYFVGTTPHSFPGIVLRLCRDQKSANVC